jgi:hypothetical protein
MLVGPATAQVVTPPAMPSPTLEQARKDTASSVQSGDQLKKTMAVVGRTEMPALRQWEREKSARVAVLSSMVLPGLGQAYNGRKWKAAVLLGFFTYYAGNAWVQHKTSVEFLNTRDGFSDDDFRWYAANEFYEFHKANASDYLWWSGAIWFIGMLDAFVDAHLFDVREIDPTIFEGTGGTQYIGLSYRL